MLNVNITISGDGPGEVGKVWVMTIEEAKILRSKLNEIFDPESDSIKTLTKQVA